MPNKNPHKCCKSEIETENVEYYVQLWSPCCREDVIEMGRVQRRLTTMLLGLGGLGFRGRLGKLKLYSLDAKEAEE